MRIRSIKPDFWSDEKMSALPAETVLLAVGLQNYADDEGFFNANPKLVAAAIFPLRECSLTVQVMLMELSRIGFVESRKSKNGMVIGRLVLFGAMQVINRPNKSVLRPVFEDSGSVQGGLRESSRRAHGGIGREGRGREKGKEGRGPNRPTGVGPGAVKALSREESIYQAYPRREAKGKALPAIVEALHHVGFEELLVAVQEYAEAVRAWPDSRRYPEGRDVVPLPASWFNGMRWEDDRAAWGLHAGGKIGGAAARGRGGEPEVDLRGPHALTGGLASVLETEPGTDPDFEQKGTKGTKPEGEPEGENVEIRKSGTEPKGE